jgi:hypothetical protein
VKIEDMDFWGFKEVETREYLSLHPGIARFFMAWTEKAK